MEKRKLPIMEQLAHCVIRLSCSDREGKISRGTGFLFNFQMNDNVQVPSIITNKHVVKGCVRGEFWFTLGSSEDSPEYGQKVPVVLPDLEEKCIMHPSNEIDLCALPIAPLQIEAQSKGIPLFYRTVDKSLVPSRETLDTLDVMEDIVMLGYPIGLIDETNNMPVVRRGITASHPKLDWNGDPIFLIDAACFPGSSGSPVFLYNAGSYATADALHVGSRLFLLGIMFAGPQFDANGRLATKPIPTTSVISLSTSIPINLGYVLKSKLISDLQIVIQGLIDSEQQAKQ